LIHHLKTEVFSKIRKALSYWARGKHENSLVHRRQRWQRCLCFSVVGKAEALPTQTWIGLVAWKLKEHKANYLELTGTGKRVLLWCNFFTGIFSENAMAMNLLLQQTLKLSWRVHMLLFSGSLILNYVCHSGLPCRKVSRNPREEDSLFLPLPSSLSRNWDTIQTTLLQRGGRDHFILQWTKKFPLWNIAWHGVPNMPPMKRLNRWTLRIGMRSRKKMSVKGGCKSGYCGSWAQKATLSKCFVP
jgi:hypothetical protein